MSSSVNYDTITKIQMQLDEIVEVTSRIKEMSPDGLMVEYGSGGSTVKWLEELTNNQLLISIEHKLEWYIKVSEYIDSRSDINQRFKYIFKPELYTFKHGYATINEEHPHGLDNYFIPQPNILDADIFFIDGVARGTTALIIKMLSKKINPVIYIHDYYGREEWYTWATQFFYKKEKVGYSLVRLWK